MNRKALLPIALIVVVDVLAFTMIFPLLPFYAESFGASPTSVGLLISSFALFQLISGPFLGALSDRYGRKNVLIVSQIGTMLGFLLMARATTLWMLFVARMLDGATAGNLSVAQAYIADVTEKEDRAKSFGIIGIAFGFGFLVGPAISGFLSQYGLAVPIYGSAAISFLSILLTTFLLKEPANKVASSDDRKLSLFEWSMYREQFKNKALAPLLFQFLCFFLAFSLFFSGFPLFAAKRLSYGPKEVGYVFAYSGLLGMIIQGGLLGKWVQKRGELFLVKSGFIAMIIGYFILAFSFHLPTLLLSATVSAYGTAVLRPSLTALISKNAAPEHQGLLLGLTQSMNSLSSIICPVIAGALIEHTYLFLWGIASSLAALIGLILHRRTPDTALLTTTVAK
jgi:MFS transporter, DHA1 family, tetracycline resistance protein